VVNQPYLFGWRDGTLYLQAYSVMEDDSRDWSKNRKTLLAKLLNPKLQKKISEHDKEIDWQRSRRSGAHPARRARAHHGRPRRDRRGDRPVAAGGEHLAGGFQLGRQDRVVVDEKTFKNCSAAAPKRRPHRKLKRPFADGSILRCASLSRAWFSPAQDCRRPAPGRRRSNRASTIIPTPT